VEFRNVDFCERGKLENPEKNPQSKVRPNNKLNPLMTPGPEFELRPHWWEVSVLTTVPPMLPYICKSHVSL